MDSLNRASGTGAAGILTAERALIYGVPSGVGFIGGGVPGTLGALAIAGALHKGSQKGLFLKPIESIAKNIDNISNFTMNLTAGRPKGAAGITVGAISKALLGEENEEEDLNKLIVGLGASAKYATSGQPRFFQSFHGRHLFRFASKHTRKKIPHGQPIQ